VFSYAIVYTWLYMMWQEEGCIIYEIFFVNFCIIILCPVFVHKNLKET